MALKAERAAAAPGRARSARLRLGGVVGALAVGAAACGGGSSLFGVEVDATPAAIARSAGLSADESHRIEMALSFGSDDPVVFAEGDVDGELVEISMDMAPVFQAVARQVGGPIPPELTELDMTMEMVGDDTVMYLMTPMFASIAEVTPFGGLGPLEDLVQLRDRWGRIDLSVFGDLGAADAQEALTGAGGLDPAKFLEVLTSVTEVEALGEGEVRGDPVTGFAAEVSMRELFEAAGMDMDALEQDPQLDDTRTTFELTLPLEVWVDGDELVRRISFRLDADNLAEALDESPEALAALGFDELDLGIRVDYFDYDQDISIELPSDSVDITETFRLLNELGDAFDDSPGLAGPGAGAPGLDLPAPGALPDVDELLEDLPDVDELLGDIEDRSDG